MTKQKVKDKTIFEWVKIGEIIMDWSLWPRYEAKELSHPHIKMMKDAYEAGFNLPPILIDRKSHRIIDGFHRYTALKQIYGPDHKIQVETKEFEIEKDMLIESAKRNSIHGLPLSSQDKVHCILKLRAMKAPWQEIADALNMTNKKAREFLAARVGVTRDGEELPLSGPFAQSIREKREREGNEEKIIHLTDKEETNKDIGGCVPVVYARLLMKALKGGMFPLSDHEREVLALLRDEIEIALQKYAKVA